MIIELLNCVFCCVSSCRSHILKCGSLGSSHGRGIKTISGGFEVFLVRLFCLVFIFDIYVFIFAFYN